MKWILLEMLVCQERIILNKSLMLIIALIINHIVK